MVQIAPEIHRISEISWFLEGELYIKQLRWGGGDDSPTRAREASLEAGIWF